MILHVAQRYRPSPRGGAERQAERLIPKLAARGLSQEVLTWDAGDPDLPRREEVDGVLVHRLRERGIRIGGRPRMAGLWWGLSLLFFLLRRPRRYRCVHVHTLTELAASAKLWCWLLGIPCLAAAPADREITWQSLRTRWGPLGKLMWRLATGTGYVAPMSSYLERLLREAGVREERILLLPYGVDPHGPRETGGKPGLRVVSTSSLIPVKRLDMLVESAVRLRDELPEVEWLLAGEGPEHSRLEALIRSKGLEDKVRLPGYLEDVRPLLSQAHVYAHPSEDEGVANSILEAMAAGLPVVVRKAPFNEEVVADGKTGLLFDGTLEGLTDCLRRCLKDGDLRARLGERAREHAAENHGFDRVCDEYLSILERMERRPA